MVTEELVDCSEPGRITLECSLLQHYWVHNIFCVKTTLRAHRDRPNNTTENPSGTNRMHYRCIGRGDGQNGFHRSTWCRVLAGLLGSARLSFNKLLKWWPESCDSSNKGQSFHFVMHTGPLFLSSFHSLNWNLTGEWPGDLTTQGWWLKWYKEGITMCWRSWYTESSGEEGWPNWTRPVWLWHGLERTSRRRALSLHRNSSNVFLKTLFEEILNRNNLNHCVIGGFRGNYNRK